MTEGYVVTAGGRRSTWGDLWRRRGLLLSLVLREVQVRYRQAALGAAWAVAQPLALAAVLTLVFERVLGVAGDGSPYALFALAGLVPWTYLHGAVTAAVPSLVSNADLVRKIHFPREALPLAGILAVGLDLVAGFAVLLVAAGLGGRPPTPALLALVPLVLVLVATAAGLGLLGAAVNVRWRDVKHALPLLLQLLFFASPIVYPFDRVPEGARAWLALNPLVGVIEGTRAAVLHGRWPEARPVLVGAAVALALLLVAARLFRGAERRFADVV